MAEVLGIGIGDHIEQINGLSMVGCRHHEVGKALSSIPVGSSFTLRLVEPVKPDWSKWTRIASLETYCGVQHRQNAQSCGHTEVNTHQAILP